VNIIPYRSSFVHKNEIERLVKEMLVNRVIQHIISLFASSILLVKKKYSSWRFCVDYWQLNKLTIKNKFSIPLIDDLIDELHGSPYFSKLNLKSRYHQVRMQACNIKKTTFHTHYGNYKLKVMPFSLTNAPATFQALMNNVMEPFLVNLYWFFYDIMIYSSSLKLHINHLRNVLQTLRNHHLFSRKSRCSFYESQVEYLRHIVSARRVAIDLNKTASIRDLLHKH